MRNKILAYTCMGLCLAQVALMLASWLLTAAMPDDFMHSLLSAEGIRWFFGQFADNLASPWLVWLLVGSIAYGVVVRSGILRYDSGEYRQRVALRLVFFEFLAFVVVILLLTLLPHAILLNVMGALFPSSFSQSFIPYVAFAVSVMGCSYGLMSGRLKGILGIYEALTTGVRIASPLFLLYVLAVQLVYSILYVA